MNDITVDELYNYILKDALKRKQQVRTDVKNNLLSATRLNTLLLGDHPEVFNYNPDTELEHIDSVLGKPQGQDAAWEEDSTYEQLPEDIADEITENKAKANNQDFSSNELPEDVAKNVEVRTPIDASENLRHVIFDKILSNVQKNNKLTDEQKKTLALRLLYNSNTPGKNKILPDIKLTQDILREELGDIPVWEKAMVKNPHLFNYDRINTDYLPLTYDSDKLEYDDISWDENGNEYSTKKTNYLFHPLDDSRHVYDIFVNNLIDDIHANNKKIDKPYNLASYINDKYVDALKTMTYDDWEKELARLDDSINEQELNTRVQNFIDQEMKTTGRKIPYRKEELQQIRDMFRVAMSDTEVDESKVNLLEDRKLPDPDKIKLSNKTKEEKESNKLARHHGYGRDRARYQQYLADRAAAANPNNIDAQLDRLSSIQDIKDHLKEKIFKQRVPDVTNKLASIIASEARTNKPEARKRLHTQRIKYENLFRDYARLTQKNPDPEAWEIFERALDLEASKIWARQHRDKYKLQNNEEENWEQGTTMEEEIAQFKKNSKYTGPDSELNKRLMEELDKMITAYYRAKSLASDVAQEDFEEKGYGKKRNDNDN